MHLDSAIIRASLTRTKGRLALITGVVAFGVMMLLAFAAFWNATSVSSHEEWREAAHLARTDHNHKLAEKWSAEDGAAGDGDTVAVQAEAGDVETEATVSGPLEPGAIRALVSDMDPVMMVGDRIITVLYVDTAGTVDPQDLAGITWPEHGQYLVSEGVRRLSAEYPQATLEDRFGRESLGVLPQELTQGPDSLLVIVGADLSRAELAFPIGSFDVDGPVGVGRYKPVLVIGLIVLMFPVLMLVSVSAAMGSVQREQRYAALRLVGATTGQVTRILVLESLLGAVAGYVLGAVLFVVFRPAFAQIPLAGNRYWADDVVAGPLAFVVTALVTLALVVGANLWGLRGISATPLGVVRRQRSATRPSPLRLLGVGAALAIFTYLFATTEPDAATPTQINVFLVGLVLMMGGLVAAAPWLIWVIAGASARWARSAPAVIGNNYVRAHSKRTARAVSGIVLALFAGTFFITTISEANAAINASSNRIGDVMPEVTVPIGNINDQLAQDLRQELAAKPYVAETLTAPFLASTWVAVPCADAGTHFGVSCRTGEVVAVNMWAELDRPEAIVEAVNYGELTARVRDEFNAYVDESETALIISLKESGDIERLRTDLAKVGLEDRANMFVFARGQNLPGDDGIVLVMTYLVYAGIALTLAIAVVSMIVSTYAGILGRRRSLFTLRLGGMRVRELVAMMLVEAVTPLAVIAVLTTAAGYGVGWLLMEMQSATLDASFSPVLFGAVVAALVLAVLAVLALAPTMRRVTEPVNNARE